MLPPFQIIGYSFFIAEVDGLGQISGLVPSAASLDGRASEASHWRQGGWPVGTKSLGKDVVFLTLIILKLVNIYDNKNCNELQLFSPFNSVFETHVLYCEMGGLVPRSNTFASAQATVSDDTALESSFSASGGSCLWWRVSINKSFFEQTLPMNVH